MKGSKVKELSSPPISMAWWESKVLGVRMAEDGPQKTLRENGPEVREEVPEEAKM